MGKYMKGDYTISREVTEENHGVCQAGIKSDYTSMDLQLGGTATHTHTHTGSHYLVIQTDAACPDLKRKRLRYPCV
jgi:hypothetical protein